MKAIQTSLFAMLFSCTIAAHQFSYKNYPSEDSLLAMMPLANLLLASQALICSKIRRCMELPSEDEGSQQKTFTKGQAGAADGKGEPVRHKSGNQSGGSRDSGDSGDDQDKKKEKADAGAGKDTFYEAMVALLKKQLANIGDLLEKNSIKLILVFDLDGTLYLPPDLFNERIKNELTQKQLIELQQQWFTDFSLFIQKYRANLLLIYNTARYYAEDPLKADQYMMSLELPFEAEGADNSLMKFKPCCEHGYSKSFGWLGIPKPDVFITDYGRRIRFSESLEQEVDEAKLDRTRQILDREYSATKQEAEKLVHSDFSKVTWEYLAASQTAIQLYVNVPAESTQLTRVEFEQALYKKPRRTAICPGLRKVPAGNRLTHSQSPYVISGVNTYFSSVVNKGSALYLSLELLKSYLHSDGTPREKIWEVVFGDACADLPMIRPDLEVRAFSIIPEEYMKERTKEFREFHVIQDYKEPPYWKLSVVLSKTNLHWLHGSHVQESLNHEKVAESDASGLPGLLGPVLRKLM